MTEAGQQVQTFPVPDLGEGLEDVTVTEWHVSVGDAVELNQPLCTVETAKAEVDIPSPYPGRVVELGGATGDVLSVGAMLVRIDTDDQEQAGGSDSKEPADREEDANRTEPSPGGVEPNGTAGRQAVLVGYGADDAVDTSRRVPARRRRAVPAARRLAAELDVDLEKLPVGVDEVITREMVLAAARHTGAARDLDLVTDAEQPVGAVQATMAERMTLSRSKIPDAHASIEVDGTKLLSLCDRLSAIAESITPFVVTLRLLTLALTRHPVLNSTWIDTPGGARVRTHGAVHLGFAVAAPRGLLVPVVTDAQRRTTREIAEVVSRLIRDARAGVLKPAEMQGSTFTVSNFGALGLDDGVPVINYPEAAILGMGALKPRPTVRDGAVAARPGMTLTCVFDHRVADGAQVAGFLRELRDLIESPETALLDL